MLNPIYVLWMLVSGMMLVVAAKDKNYGWASIFGFFLILSILFYFFAPK